jgi:hypothetical protein
VLAIDFRYISHPFHHQHDLSERAVKLYMTVSPPPSPFIELSLSRLNTALLNVTNGHEESAGASMKFLRVIDFMIHGVVGG